MSGSYRLHNNQTDGAERGSQVPLYVRIKRELTERILMGVWLPGDKLPGEVQLAEEFNVAVGTIRRALIDLTAEGFVTRRPKTGTVVTGRTPHHNLRNFFQYFRFHDLDGGLLRSTARIIEATEGRASPHELRLLNLEEECQLVRIHRVRSVKGRPVMHEKLCIPTRRVPNFPLQGVPELLYISLFELYGIRISAVREQLSAEPASSMDSELLAVAEGTPLLIIDEIAYDQLAVPIICAHHRAITDKYRYVNEIS
ncbi:GntR family transcriptional regulator [Chelativorans sp. AA-79]|uniref:GntR family transcriptional regulator n=1 Tax=Chelativorans sp. AA-79 TaxID=3028735 RepID=UPI0023F91CD1|nr:GntR family transcriptional regulator [Chelativorans sp. AA-79]WEX09674.1 GntR family transcriptional regulator [Chelativorans sp. AA-79]